MAVVLGFDLRQRVVQAVSPRPWFWMGNEWEDLSRLCRAGARTGTSCGRHHDHEQKPACRPTSQPPCVQRSKQMAQRRASCHHTVRAFNPVRKAFAKLKAVLPKAATRTTKELWTAIADALAVFTPQECENYCVACGHEPD